MKAVIVEIQNNTVAILSDKGEIYKIKNNNYKIGQEVFITMKKKKVPNHIFAYAAAACLLVFLGLGTYVYASPYTYISVDVNPSIEYSLNRFDRVLSVIGVNDDGTELIKEINLTNLENKNIEDALALTIDQLSASGYFDIEGSGLIITTSSDDTEKDTRLANDLEIIANERVNNSKHEAFVISEVVDAMHLEEAKSKNITPGKMILVERLVESAGSTESIKTEEWLQKSVREILMQTNQYKEQRKETIMDPTIDPVKEQEKNQEQGIEPPKGTSPSSKESEKEENGENNNNESAQPSGKKQTTDTGNNTGHQVQGSGSNQ